MPSARTAPVRLEDLEVRLGHRFRDRELLRLALTHPSVGAGSGPAARNNQRLEFLGDSVLQLALGEALFRHKQEAREGVLTTLRSQLCNGRFLSAIAEELGLVAHLHLGAIPAGAEASARDRMGADAVEALLGAIFLDSDYPTAAAAALRWIGNIEVRLAEAEPNANPKGALQEAIQPVLGNGAIGYELVEQRGADHARVFICRVLVTGEELGRGEGRSRQAAESEAARQALPVWKARLPSA